MSDELENRSENSSRGAPQLNPWKFKKGRSGNPGGRPRKKPIEQIQILIDPKNRALLRRAIKALSGSALVVLVARDERSAKCQ